METKCIVLGAQPSESKKPKPIEFIHAIVREKGGAGVSDRMSLPKQYLNLELISPALNLGYYDTIFAYDTERRTGRTYLGHWNDGVAE